MSHPWVYCRMIEDKRLAELLTDMLISQDQLLEVQKAQTNTLTNLANATTSIAEAAKVIQSEVEDLKEANRRTVTITTNLIGFTRGLKDEINGLEALEDRVKRIEDKLFGEEGND